MCQGKFRLNIRIKVFTESLVQHWNKLHRNVVMTSRLFKKCLGNSFRYSIWLSSCVVPGVGHIDPSEFPVNSGYSTKNCMRFLPEVTTSVSVVKLKFYYVLWNLWHFCHLSVGLSSCANQQSQVCTIPSQSLLFTQETAVAWQLKLCPTLTSKKAKPAVGQRWGITESSFLDTSVL